MRVRGLARLSVVLLYISAIYLTIPYIPRWWIGLQRLTGASFHSISLVVLGAVGGGTIVGGLYRIRPRSAALAWLAALGVVYFYLYGHVFQEPIERLHLVQYGLLSWAIWWAWPSSRISAPQRAIGVWLLNAAVGAGDELIQHFTPGRFGEFRDVLINWESAALGLAVLLVLLGPHTSRTESRDIP
jgi:VanZ family protein